jgi:uncharacterized protein YbgA (DUF1722 family)/uncharacterized protein YbbK (DUF523 family)
MAASASAGAAAMAAAPAEVRMAGVEAAASGTLQAESAEAAAPAVAAAASWRAWHDPAEPLRLGVSACLLGEPVRYDGGHKRNDFLTTALAPFVEFVPVCPELESGMGVPRPTLRLVDGDDGVRLVAPAIATDFTQRMHDFSMARVALLADARLDGYVLKKGSPSCGLQRVSVYGAGAMPRKNGTGLFAQVLTGQLPALPVEEEGRLVDAAIRENFVERIFCHNRFRVLRRRGLSRGALVAFWTAHKLLLRAHNETIYRRLGRLVGELGRQPDAAAYAAFEHDFFAALRTQATRRKHANVLMHAFGYLKNVLAAAEKQELLAAIDDYRLGLLPLVVPLSLLRFQVRTRPVDYLAGQLYFDPHPRELLIRNHV